MRVLVLNPGSSSLKASLIETDGLATLASTQVERINAAAGSDGEGRGSVGAAVEALESSPRGAAAPDAVGYRVVHGGETFTQPVRLNASVLHQLDGLAELAPLHNPVSLATIREGMATFGAIPQVACFDTAFHVTLPPERRTYPVPAAWTERWGLRRFGFHGLSVEWSVGRAAELLDVASDQLNLVVAHLGSGSSATAVAGGRSVATTMGYTPLEGLMMSTRAGSVDPGLLLQLIADGRLSVGEMADALEHESGLKGVAGQGDLRDVEADAAGGDAPACLALAMFADRAASGIAGVAAALPRLDALVFTGGIGERSAPMRQRITERLAVLGVPPVDATEPATDGVLAIGPPAVLRVAAREDLVIAGAAARILV